jgi:4-amino-4-deoxy-L-arabinose transferase-like glycosyltransferase
MIAKTDAFMTGCTTFALAALVRLKLGDGRVKILALAFWGAIGMGILIKGPVTPMVAGLALAAICLWERRWDWTRPLSWWPGPTLAAAICLPWLIAIGVATQGQFFAEAIGHDLGTKVTGGAEHPFSPPGVHTLLLLILFFPATIGLVPGARLAWQAIRAPRADEANSGVRILLAWALPSFLVFELASTKLAHYTLPTYPALALICGAGLVWALGRPGWRWFSALIVLIGAGLLIVLAAYVSGLMPGDTGADERRAVQAALTLAPFALLAIGFALVPRRLDLVLAGVVVCALALMFTLRERLLPEAREVLVSREASLALERAGLTGNAATLVIGYREPSLVFVLGTKTILLQGREAGLTAKAGQSVLLEGREKKAFEAGLSARGLTFAPEGEPVKGLNYSNGDEVELQPGRVAPALPAIEDQAVSPAPL